MDRGSSDVRLGLRHSRSHERNADKAGNPSDEGRTLIMPCSCGAFLETAEQQFSKKKAASEIARYRKKGPGPTTRLLRDGLVKAGSVQGTMLDIGGGIGALSFELLDRGAARAIIVDASPAYLAAASDEADRRGRAGATSVVQGDFVMLSEQLPSTDFVTLDRVVCCFPTYQSLLQKAVEHAACRFAYSYPRDRWFVRLWVRIDNARRRWWSNPFRTFVHPPGEMQGIVEGGGFTLASRHCTLAWTADVFVKTSATSIQDRR
jgi:SAM-dependent methyltransferase